jgi:hypothetical protein
LAQTYDSHVYLWYDSPLVPEGEPYRTCCFCLSSYETKISNPQ